MAEKKTMDKNMILAAVGIGLQTVGNLCMLAASVRIAKEANRKIKQVIVRELSKQLEGTE